MGTIAEKLQYTWEAKKAIVDSINSLANSAGISSNVVNYTDDFKNIANVIKTKMKYNYNIDAKINVTGSSDIVTVYLTYKQVIGEFTFDSNGTSITFNNSVLTVPITVTGSTSLITGTHSVQSNPSSVLSGSTISKVSSTSYTVKISINNIEYGNLPIQSVSMSITMPNASNSIRLRIQAKDV